MGSEDLGWHVISGEQLLDTLRRVDKGEDPDLVYTELWANATHETMNPPVQPDSGALVEKARRSKREMDAFGYPSPRLVIADYEAAVVMLAARLAEAETRAKAAEGRYDWSVKKRNKLAAAERQVAALEAVAEAARDQVKELRGGTIIPLIGAVEALDSLAAQDINKKGEQ